MKNQPSREPKHLCPCKRCAAKRGQTPERFGILPPLTILKIPRWAKKTRWRVGTMVRVRGHRKIATIIALHHDVDGEVRLDQRVGDFFSWNIQDLVRVKKTRRSGRDTMRTMPCGCFAHIDQDGVILAFQAVCAAMKAMQPSIHPRKVGAHFKLNEAEKEAVK